MEDLNKQIKLWEDIQRIADHYGHQDQGIQCIEEMAELTKELSKQYRYGGRRADIAEEIADVELMLEQLKYLYEIPEDEVEQIIRMKVDRQLRRMQDE